jgi:SAM-dependent methyltransferase
MTASGSGREAALGPGAGNAFERAEAAEGWRNAAAMRALAYAAATDLLFEWADLQPGQRVLDIAAGTGETSVLAAQKVGPSGYVLATDISASMIAVAAEEAQKSGLANLEARTMDARTLDLPDDSFDAVISRMGIMLMPRREEALAEMRRVLKPGGKLVVVVWGTGERNLGSYVPQSIARRHAKLPPPAPDAPGMFALGGEGALEKTLTDAGFNSVRVRAVPAPRRFPNAAEMMRFYTGGTPMMHDSLSVLDEAGKAAALAEIEDTMRQFEGPDGISIPGQALVGFGTT